MDLDTNLDTIKNRITAYKDAKCHPESDESSCSITEKQINEISKFLAHIIPTNNDIKLEDIKQHFNSTTKLGDYVYENNLEVQNPIFKLNEKYNKSSFDKIKQHYGK